MTLRAPSLGSRPPKYKASRTSFVRLAAFGGRRILSLEGPLCLAEPSKGFGSQGWGGGGQEAAALKQLCALEGWGPGGPGELQGGGGQQEGPQEQAVPRTLREGPPVGAFGCRQLVQQDTPSLSPLSSLLCLH